VSEQGAGTMAKDSKAVDAKPWTVHDLWAKYEDIAMHFNDLLIRLRTQALAAVAAISTVVGIFTKTDPTSVHISWEIATAVFAGLWIFWLAVWAIDRFYYNRLLIGAVIALREIEKESKKPNPSLIINMSTTIERFVANPIDDRSFWDRVRSKFGVYVFYLLVFVALTLGTGFCYCHELQTRKPAATSAVCDCFVSRF
jgi:hypothetical protein